MRPSPEHRRVMENWEALFECEDARELERKKKQDRLQRDSKVMTKLVSGDIADVQPLWAEEQTRGIDAELSHVMKALSESNFFDQQAHSLWHTDGKPPIMDSLTLVKENCVLWEAKIKQDTKQLIMGRRQHGSLHTQALTMSQAPETVNPSTTFIPITAPATRRITDMGDLTTFECDQDLINNISQKFSLNKEQEIAFNVIAKSYLSFNRLRNAAKIPEQYIPEHPLRLFLTGPGGTGKTHVASALHHLMELLGCGHQIKVVAPTASAAKTANGSTCHAGFKIKIRQTQGNKHDTDRDSYILDVTDREALRMDWKHVDVVLVDEVSLLSLQLLAEIDQALRYAKE